MIGIALIAIASGALFWRLQKMVERSRFDTDVKRFQSLLLLTRNLAINTKMDYRLDLKQMPDSWAAHLFCREDPDLSYPVPKLSALEITLNRTPIHELSIHFYSTGFVGPKGLITLGAENQKKEFKFPELFYRQEDLPLVPLHPSEIK